MIEPFILSAKSWYSVPTMNYLSVAYIREKWQDAGFQKYFQNTKWMFSMRILSMLGTLASTLVVARNLGPTNFGQLNYALSFVGIFSFIVSLGVDNVLYRELIKFPEKKKEFLGSAFVIKIASGCTGALFLLVSAYFWAEDDVSKVLIYILSATFVLNAFQIIGLEFQARVKSKYSSIITFLMSAVLALLNIIIVITGKGVIYLALATVAQSLLYAACYWFIYEKKLGEKVFDWKYSFSIALTLIKDSWPLMFSSAFALIYSEIDQVLLKHMMNAYSVGVYDSAVRVVEAWYFMPTLLVTALFPAIINAKMTSKETYLRRLKKLYLFLFASAVAAALGCTLFAHPIIKILYGSQFFGGVAVLQIYVWSLIGTFVGYLVANYLIAENYTKISFFMNLIPMTVNVLLDLMWIPKYGIMGPAYATLIAYSFSPFILLIFRKTRMELFEMVKI